MSAASTLVLFDCDGVLVDSERLVIDIDVAAVTAAGWPMTREQAIEAFVGREQRRRRGDDRGAGGSSAAAGLGRGVGSGLPPRVRRAAGAGAGRPGGGRAGRWRSGRRTCVASSGSHDKMRRTLGRTGLAELFEGRIFSATEVEHGKPAPDLFLHAAPTMQVDPGRCVVVEDSRYGVAAARVRGHGASWASPAASPRSTTSPTPTW